MRLTLLRIHAIEVIKKSIIIHFYNALASVRAGTRPPALWSLVVSVDLVSNHYVREFLLSPNIPSHPPMNLPPIQTLGTVVCPVMLPKTC